MLVTTLALIDSQVFDAEELVREPLPIGALPAGAPRGLLVTVISVEDAAFHVAYTAVVAYALLLDAAGHPAGVDLLHPLTELAEREQATLRSALTRRSWAAWARSPQHVRQLLGCPEPPLLLADAARQLGFPLPTLASAAVRGRLPTIRAGDRHLIYLATVIEAQNRDLLHLHRGRPRGRAQR